MFRYVSINQQEAGSSGQQSKELWSIMKRKGLEIPLISIYSFFCYLQFLPKYAISF